MQPCAQGIRPRRSPRSPGSATGSVARVGHRSVTGSVTGSVPVARSASLAPPPVPWAVGAVAFPRLEHASVPVAERLNALPRLVLPLVVLALFVVSVLVPAFGWVPLVLVAALIAWFLFLTWPRLSLPERLMRSTVLLMVIAAAIVRAFPR